MNARRVLAQLANRIAVDAWNAYAAAEHREPWGGLGRAMAAVARLNPPVDRWGGWNLTVRRPEEQPESRLLDEMARGLEEKPYRLSAIFSAMGPSAVAAVPALLVMLQSKSSHARHCAWEALGTIGLAVAPWGRAILDALEQQHGVLSPAQALALGKIGPGALGERGVSFLREYVLRWQTPPEAARALQRMGEPHAAEVAQLTVRNLADLDPETFSGRARASELSRWIIEGIEPRGPAARLVVPELIRRLVDWRAADLSGQPFVDALAHFGSNGTGATEILSSLVEKRSEGVLVALAKISPNEAAAYFPQLCRINSRLTRGGGGAQRCERSQRP